MQADNFLQLCKQVANTSFNKLLAACLPSNCALCAQRCTGQVCADCLREFFRADLGQAEASRCRQCALPLTTTVELCGACLQQAPAFDATFTACDYAAPLDQLVLALKFGARLELAGWMAERLRDALLLQAQAQAQTQTQTQTPTQAQDLPDLLCPVPLGQQRLRERGYNQALEIARPLSRQLGITLDPRLCLRQRETVAQSALPLAVRGRNLRQAFSISPHAAGKIAGLHIGVVDDVMTTGHTLQEISLLLKTFGARRVSNFVFARTPPP